MLDSKGVSVGTTATLLHTATGYQVVTVHNPTGGQSVYLGPADVTANADAATSGLVVPSGTTVSVKLKTGDALYGRVAATTQSVSVLVSN